jgi:predicted transcriptional regulator
MNNPDLETRLMFIPKYAELKKKYNTLLGKYELLEEETKTATYKKVMKIIDNEEKMKRLSEENKRLRKQIKEFKETLKSKGEKNGK